MKNIRKIFLLFFLIAGIVSCSLKKNGDNKLDIKFFVAADLHFDPPPETDQYYHVVAMNSVCGSLQNKTALIWPDEIDNVKTNFSCANKKINPPNGVILVGDITDRADPAALQLLEERYEIGTEGKQIHFPVYLGLGNHDLDPQHVEGHEKEYRKQMLEYVAERHKGKNAPVPSDNFDDKSFNYSWNWGNLHLIQTHRFAGNTENNHFSSLEWMRDDLKKYASDGRPVIIFQHYGLDEFSLNWWSDKDRGVLKEVIEDYNVIGIFVGHNHYAENLEWEGIPVFQVNNAWKDEDGNGSFAICHITDEYINVVTCRWKDGEGNVELVAPFFTKNINQK